MKVLIADDDPQILSALRIILRAHGYETALARTGRQAIDLAVREPPDLLLLDLGMPQADGIDVITAIRGWSRLPILVVSGRTGSADKVDALDAGADDYVTKPFATTELLARMRALTRRSPTGAPDEPSVRFGDITIDLADRRVTSTASGTTQAIRLTPTEWAILDLLVRNPNRLVTQRMILDEVWGPHHIGDTGYLRLYISQLRKKLERVPSQPEHLLTEAGMGYRFVP